MEERIYWGIRRFTARRRRWTCRTFGHRFTILHDPFGASVRCRRCGMQRKVLLP